MKIKEILINILLYVAFAVIPIWPYFTFGKYSYFISWWCYVILGLICIGISCWIFSLLCAGISVRILSHFDKRKTNNVKIIPEENKSFKRNLILLGLSVLGYGWGSNVLTYIQMHKFNSIIKKSILYEEKNGRKPVNLEELNLDDKIIDSELYSMRHSSLSLNDENCKASFTYKTVVIFNFDTDCDVICCLNKPAGPPYEFVANGYADYKWYRFCSF